MKRNLLTTIVFALSAFFTCQASVISSLSGCSDAGASSASKDSICIGGTTDLILSGYTGAIQWQSYSGTLWVDETGTGSTTDNYTVTLSASTDFRTVVTQTGCPPDTSNVTSIVVGVTAPSTTGVSRCGYGQVTVNATGGNIKWYDAATGGNAIGSGSSYSATIASTTTFYASASSVGGGSATAQMPAEVATFSGNVRGYWFTAPSDFTITGLFIPNPANGATQNIAVLKFNPAVPPPVYSMVTNAFSVEFLTQNDPSTGVIPCNVSVTAGDVIGILGSRGANDVCSYAQSPSTTIIDGQTVTITRLGMQYPLATQSPIDVWQEASGSISRVELTYVVGCESSRTAAVATVTVAEAVSITASDTSLCQGLSSVLTANSGSLTYTYAWSPSAGLSASTGASVTATPAAPVTYTVIASDSVCGAIDSIFIDVGPASAAGTAVVTTDSVCLGSNTILQLTGWVGNIQWQSNTGSGWFNETGVGNNAAQYQVAPTVSIDYRAVVTSGGCNPDTSIVLHVEVLTIVDPVTTNDSVCGPGVVNLGASGTGLLSWFTSPAGGTAVNTGPAYAPNISATTTYYVQASAGVTVNVGPANNSIGGQTNVASVDWGLQFDVIQQATIEKVYIYPQANGTVTINLRDAIGGPVLNTVTVNVVSSSGKTPVNLGFTVNPFTGYRLEVAAGSATLGYNFSGGNYPFTVPGSPVTITGYINPNFGNIGLYYFMYDWVVSTGCKSNLIPVTGVVMPLPPVPSITQNLNILTSSSPTGNQWYLNGNIIPGATGQTYNYTLSGSYTVSVTGANGCTSVSTPFIAVGIEEFGSSGISVYPNPAIDKVMINFPSSFSENAALKILNMMGAVIYETKQAGKTTSVEIDIKKFAAGAYSLEIRTSKNVYRKEFLKL